MKIDLKIFEKKNDLKLFAVLIRLKLLICNHLININHANSNDVKENKNHVLSRAGERAPSFSLSHGPPCNLDDGVESQGNHGERDYKGGAWNEEGSTALV